MGRIWKKSGKKRGKGARHRQISAERVERPSGAEDIKKDDFGPIIVSAKVI